MKSKGGTVHTGGKKGLQTSLLLSEAGVVFSGPFPEQFLHRVGGWTEKSLLYKSTQGKEEVRWYQETVWIKILAMWSSLGQVTLLLSLSLLICNAKKDDSIGQFTDFVIDCNGLTSVLAPANCGSQPSCSWGHMITSGQWTVRGRDTLYVQAEVVDRPYLSLFPWNSKLGGGLLLRGRPAEQWAQSYLPVCLSHYTEDGCPKESLRSAVFHGKQISISVLCH